MPINTGNNKLDSLLNDQLLALASRNVKQGNLLSTVASIREAEFHDFSSYRFLLPPNYMRRFKSPTGSGVDSTVDGTDVPIGVWMDFNGFAALFDTVIYDSIDKWIESEVSKMSLGGYDSGRGLEVSDAEIVNAIKLNARDGFRDCMAPDLFKIYSVTEEREQFLLCAYKAVDDWLKSSLFSLCGNDGRYDNDELFSVGTAAFWESGIANVTSQLSGFLPAHNDKDSESGKLGEDFPDSYTFEPFMPNSVNFGLQIIYRQSWVPLGTQPGEIVRTLPLGPKQSEKISVKVLRRTKATRQSELSTNIEAATESSAATKDSSEVVQEAADSFKWHAEATADASWGFGSASVTAGAGGENSSASKNTKSQLNETMEKTAGKIRKDTKIIVSTEAEETSELSQMSEITNPNDEIAVTYIYSRLQRQYEIRTYLSEVNQVIFVAESIPAPEEITKSWIRSYDWIIAKELLDESFRSDLDIVRNYERDNVKSEEMDKRICSLMESISGDGSKAPGIPDYKSLQGQIPDLFQTQQAAYERELERKRAKEVEQERYRRSEHRIRAHICDNILHYCRAIWSSEDPDTRILRYQQIRVPIKWEFISTSSGPHSVQGYFVPAITNFELDTAPLSDLVNPAGPIGFAGNYSVFYLKQSTRWSSLLQMLSIVEFPFLVFHVLIERNDINQAITLRAAVSDNIAGPGRFRCTYGLNADGAPKLAIYELRDGSNWVFLRDCLIKNEKSIEFLGIRLWIDGIATFVDGDTFEIVVTTEQMLEDPELKALRWSVPPLTDNRKTTFFSQTVISEMREYFTDVFLAFDGSDVSISWEKSSEEQKAVLENRYYDYLLRKQHTRRILLDTNNLLLTREVDGVSTLEPFKGLHRVVDVLKAFEEFKKISLENDRKRARLDANKLGDPDVDKLTVVASVPGAATLAALDGFESDTGSKENSVEGG